MLNELTEEQAYFRSRAIEAKFDSIEGIIERNMVKGNKLSLMSMMRKLESEAIQCTEGWGVRLFFFLRGIHAVNLLSATELDQCMNLFDEYSQNEFANYIDN